MAKTLAQLKSYWVIFTTMVRIFRHIIRGVSGISRFRKPPVSIFGGTHFTVENRYIEQARTLARMLTQVHIPILTGGGPGIMEAASCGAITDRKKLIYTMGIGVKGLEDITENKCLKENVIIMEEIFSRQWLLTTYSVGFVVFPGGFGTLNELTLLLTMIQTKLHERSPIILVGTDYWKPFITWVQESALQYGLITQKDSELFILTDDLDAAFTILKACYNKN